MILIGTDGGIYRWFEGAGWPVFHSLQGRAIVGLASPGSGVLAALDRDGQVFESVNNGQDWLAIPRPDGAGAPTALALWGMPPTIVLATQPLGLYGRVVGAPLPQSTATTAGRPPALLARARALAEGATALLPPRRGTAPAPRTAWSKLGKPEVAKGKVAASALIRALAIGDGSPAPWYAAIQGAGLWRSPDGGTSWTQCPGLPDEVLALRTIPGRPGGVIAATADGCRYSGDGGQTWEDRSGGLEKLRYVGAIDVRPDRPDTMLAGVAPRAPGARGAAPADGLGFSLYESGNGGKSWTRAKHGFPEDFAHDVIRDIRHDPSAPENVVVALDSGELWVSRNEGFYWSPLARQIRFARTLCAVG
jgi:hypothetical protein